MSDEVRAEVVDQPVLLGEAGRWLAEKRAEVDAIAGEFEVFPIASDEDYRQAKRMREACRRKAGAIDAEKRSMTSAIKQAVKAFDAEAKELLAPLTEADEGYKANIGEWEDGLREARRMRLAEAYAEMAPALVPLVGFDAIMARFSEVGRGGVPEWLKLSGSEAKAREALSEALSTIAEEEAAIESMGGDPDEVAEAKAEYFSTLDVARTLRALNERRSQRARVAELEAERRAMVEERREAERKAMEERIAAAERTREEPRVEEEVCVVVLVDALDREHVRQLRDVMRLYGAQAKVQVLSQQTYDRFKAFFEDARREAKDGR